MRNATAAASLIAFLTFAGAAAAEEAPPPGMIGLRLGVVGSDVSVLGVVPGSPAAQAGISVGDALQTVDGRPVGPMTLAQISARLRGPAGTEVSAAFSRGDAAPVEYRLVRADPGRAAPAPAEGLPGMVGLRLGMSGPDVAVVEVIPASPAAEAGIAPGDRLLAVDGDPVAAETLARIVSRLRGPAGAAVMAEFERAGRRSSYRLVRRVLPQAAAAPPPSEPSHEAAAPSAPRALRPKLSQEEAAEELLP